MRKRKAIVTWALVAVASLACWAAPVLSVDHDTYEFGAVMEGSFVRHSFVVTNTGNERLEISRVRSTCGCTTSALATNSLAPGQSVQLEVAFDTAGYGGRTVTKTLTIESNDPKAPQKTVYLRGEVKKLGAHQITQTDLESLLYLLVDLRPAEEYEAGHILGAVNVPFSVLGQYVGLLPRGMLIIVYDEDGTLAELATPVLQQNGYRDVKSLFGGFARWVEVMGGTMVWPLRG